MSKFAIALAAAALLAAPSFSSTAEAGGIRLGFGFPLGSFIARPHQSYNSGGGYERYQAKKEARQARLAAARQQAAASRQAQLQKAQAQKMAAAEKAAQIKRAKAAEAAKVAKVETKAVTTDPAPTVYVPVANAAATPVTTAPVTETAAVTAEPAKTAALEPAATTETTPDVKAEKVEKVEKPAVEKSNVKVTSATAKRVCRRFSAAIAGLIDVPCE